MVFPEVLGGYEKIRFKGLDFESDHLFGQEATDTFTILENGVTYEVFLNDGLMTGIFLDQHEVRDGLVNGLALGKSVLNMFSYTGSFLRLAAAMGGAVERHRLIWLSVHVNYRRLILKLMVSVWTIIAWS